jgi:hypothetical protein
MQMQNSTWTNLALTVRALSAHVALADLEWLVERDRDADGGAREQAGVRLHGSWPLR